jgi:hypothetical protein
MRKASGVIRLINVVMAIFCAACATQGTARSTLPVQATLIAKQSRPHAAPQWTLAMTYPLKYKSAYGEGQLLLTWSGSFDVTDAEISGNGSGRVAGQHRCGTDSAAEDEVDGEFDFQIAGESIAQANGQTRFRLMIEGKDLAIRSDAPCPANFYEIAVTARLQTLAEQLPSLVKYIEIEARTGASTTVSLPDAFALFNGAPLNVELTAAPGK